MLRAQVGLVDLADLLFLTSKEYANRLTAEGESLDERGPFLFDEKVGRIAFGNRRREPLFLFAGMQRHLGYPQVPRPEPRDETNELIPQLARRVERLEFRLKLMEDERRGGVDLTKYYEKAKKEIFPDESLGPNAE